MGETFRSSVLRLAHEDRTEFFEPWRSRTFPWYLVLFRIALEDCSGSLRLFSKGLNDDRTQRHAREVVGILRELHSDHCLIPEPGLAARLLRETLDNQPLFDDLTRQIMIDVGLHLNNAEEVARYGRKKHAYKLPRRPARKRQQLADAEQPGWAGVNRMPSQKVQMPCRVVPDIKKLIEDEAFHGGISQSRWLEEAIAEKLQRQGHPVYLPAPSKAPKTSKGSARRPRRASLPHPDKSRSSAANRADKMTTVRFSRTLAAQMDRARGRSERSAWLNEAVSAFMDEEARLPEALAPKQALPVAVSVGFDHQIFAAIERAAKKSKLTKSECIRRVVTWYLTDKL